MTSPYVVAGQVPADSPATALAGRLITLPAGPHDVTTRVEQLLDAGATPVILPARTRPWTRAALGLTSTTIAGALTATAGIATSHGGAQWTGAAVMAAAGAALLPAVTRAEAEQ